MWVSLYSEIDCQICRCIHKVTARKDFWKLADVIRPSNLKSVVTFFQIFFVIKFKVTARKDLWNLAYVIRPLCSHLELLAGFKVSVSSPRNTLQHTLQHTAAHCNTLQHTATHYNTLQHTLQHTAVSLYDFMACRSA